MSTSEANTVQAIDNTNNVQLEDIRLLLLDAVPADYAIKTNDFYFSDSELMDARRRAVEAFNAFPPVTIRAGLQGIPDEYTYKVGTCWQACLSKALYFQRKQVTYQSSSNAVNMYGDAVKAMKEASDMFKAEFKELALSIKRQINMRRACGRIG